MAKKTLDTFTVTAKMTVLADTEIAAASFEEALCKSKDLSETDFIKFKGDFIDGKIDIINVSVYRGWDLER